MLLRVFLIYSIFLIFKVFTETEITEYCEPDDEFDTNNLEKSEWEFVMDKFDEFIFKGNYSIRCKNDTSKNVTIDANWDFLWDLRFKLYSETTNSENNTLQDCYSVGNIASEKKCDTEKFRNCMTSVRKAMIEKIDGVWKCEINKELEKLAKDC